MPPENNNTTPQVADNQTAPTPEVATEVTQNAEQPTTEQPVEWQAGTEGTVEGTEQAQPEVATSSSFSLGERDVTVVIKNASSQTPENTVFKVGDTLYKSQFLIQDFLSIGQDGVKFEFSNMKCKYVATFKVDPGVYLKNAVITYGYNKNGDCIYEVTPEALSRTTSMVITPRAELEQTIALNDLSIFNFIGYFAFGLFFVVALGITYIQKKKILIYNKKQ